MPELKNRLLHIIELCAEDVRNVLEDKLKAIDGTSNIGLIATEGTIDSGIYVNIFAKYGLVINAPSKSQYEELRLYIEAVKQNRIDEKIKKRFTIFLENFNEHIIILGCTELPILYQRCVDSGYKSSKIIVDPLQSAIDRLVSNSDTFTGMLQKS